MKILVTGGAGFIGSHVVELLVKEGMDVIIVDDLSTGQLSNIPPQVTFYQANIVDAGVATIFQNEKPDFVIHLAAQVDVAKSIKHPMDDANINIVGTINLLNLCKEYHVRKIVYASTCSVYGEVGDYSITESEPIHPISSYGISKITSEMYIRLFQQQYSLPFTILRYSNVYGPRQSIIGEGCVIPAFIHKLLEGKSPVIYGDGEQTRDFVYAKDIAMANLLALFHGTNEVMNISSNEKTSVNQLFKLISSILHCTNPPVYAAQRNGDIRFSRVSSQKAQLSLGWSPQYDLATGLNETIREMSGRK
ncbi:NAD-dependent epimerase/dehydratase family protein [Brevibacillus sp. SYSU BS000544]|uniref:NAD-dependent epimerase/dehydratase family protein n=1 Tax=Brevibacillus sp. SYSU BS000544 TaxID=3416443 RepID=UPI003CE527A8